MGLSTPMQEGLAFLGQPAVNIPLEGTYKGQMGVQRAKLLL
jgi:hypothetical protein